MVDLLKRSLAPITDEAWKEIDEQARLTLKGNLAARTTVDIIGPKGWKEGAVNVGKVKPSTQQIKGVSYGIREVLPLGVASSPKLFMPTANLSPVSPTL